jgi:xylulokinase
VCERLAALGLPAREAHVLGGGARSEIWTQLRADTLDLAHHVAADVDAAPLGAARIAAVVAGVVPSLAAATALAPPPARTFVPGAPDVRAALDEAYRLYQARTRAVG